jgi:hypothetical protein
MALHGLWDGAIFTAEYSGAESAPLSGLLSLAAIVTALVGLASILDEQPADSPSPSPA